MDKLNWGHRLEEVVKEQGSRLDLLQVIVKNQESKIDLLQETVKVQGSMLQKLKALLPPGSPYSIVGEKEQSSRTRATCIQNEFPEVRVRLVRLAAGYPKDTLRQVEATDLPRSSNSNQDNLNQMISELFTSTMPKKTNVSKNERARISNPGNDSDTLKKFANENIGDTSQTNEGYMSRSVPTTSLAVEETEKAGLQNQASSTQAECTADNLCKENSKLGAKRETLRRSCVKSQDVVVIPGSNNGNGTTRQRKRKASAKSNSRRSRPQTNCTKCMYCEKTYDFMYKLENHMRSHTGEKPFQCNVCRKAFSRMPSLIAHKRIHTEEKPFKCKACPQAFRRSSWLITHKRSHTGEKPFKCNMCRKTFTQIGNLGRHKKTHNKRKPFASEFCDASFAQLVSLNYHKRSHPVGKRKNRKRIGDSNPRK